MARTQLIDQETLAEVAAEVAIHDKAVQEGNPAALPRLVRRVLEICGPDRALIALATLAARYHGEKSALKAGLDKKSRLLDSLLAAPRRLAKLLGVYREQVDARAEEAWGIVEGPPHQAVRLGPNVDPDEICPDQLDVPVWVWMIESAGTLVVAGRIDPPPLLLAGLEREMVFEGFAEGEENNVYQ